MSDGEVVISGPGDTDTRLVNRLRVGIGSTLCFEDGDADGALVVAVLSRSLASAVDTDEINYVMTRTQAALLALHLSALLTDGGGS